MDENDKIDVEKSATRARRLEAILEYVDEGFSFAVIAQRLDLDETSVKNILNNHIKATSTADTRFNSSMARALFEHEPVERQDQRLRNLKKYADEMCLILDSIGDNQAEAMSAKVRLEETVMWGVKALTLPDYR